MKRKHRDLQNQAQTFYVDIPTEDCINDDSGAWHNVGQFDTEAAALAFAKKHFGADQTGRVFLVPSQMSDLQDQLETAAMDMAAVLKGELAALRIWQSAKDPRGCLALPDDVRDGMSISIDKLEKMLPEAGVDDHCQGHMRQRFERVRSTEKEHGCRFKW